MSLREIYEKIVNEKLNNLDYKFWVVNKDGTKIMTGWEYQEDAKDFQKEDDRAGKVYQLAGLKTLGLDPNNDSDWFNEKKDGKMAKESVSEAKGFRDSVEATIHMDEIDSMLKHPSLMAWAQLTDANYGTRSAQQLKEVIKAYDKFTYLLDNAG